MSDLSDAAPWIAIGAAAAAVAALILSLAFYLKLRAVRRPSSSSGTGKDDLVNFAVSLQTRIDDLHRVVDEVAAGLARIDRRSTVASHTRLVRYNAYEDAAGTSPPRSPSSTAPAPALS